MRSIWLIPAVVVWSSAAAAQPSGRDAAPDPQADLEARARFEAGRAAMNAGRVEDALEDFRRAYELSRRPQLLFNMGIAADRLRRDEEALAAFEAYLAEMPAEQIDNRADVEQRIRVLRETIEERRTATASRSSASSAAGPDPTSIVLLVSGGAVAVAGGVMLGLGLADRASVEDAPMGTAWSEVAAAAERAPVLEVSGVLGLGIGLATAAVGVVVLLTGGGSENASSTARAGLVDVVRW